ncbi:hypothetical protein GCM10008957_43490 [Deinococcus ruber]|uniref:Toprim domain-containing protein n=2 Tax=Deinococcus ruber TaxID=1848197 RepID=A0A918FE89_9DEIO|nr:hypothetical protein GCM10008957_43490 [Deinococcus ruber]
MDLESLLARHLTHLRSQETVPQVFAGRGLTLEDLHALELGLDDAGNGVITLRDLEGRLLGLKVRLLQPAGRKYLELPEPNGNPPWFSTRRPALGSEMARGMLCVEGELNAMVTSLALRGSGWEVIGLGSAFGPVPWAWLEQRRLPVVFSLDRSRAGDKSVQAWLRQARASGLRASRAVPLLADWDACEYAHTCGREALSARWLQILAEGKDG